MIDTGSSDTWIRGNTFKCLDNNLQVVPAAACELGPAFPLSSTFQQHMDKHFAIRYGDGETLLGAVGEDTVQVGKLTVPAQRLK